jgi:hypothetical protein
LGLLPSSLPRHILQEIVLQLRNAKILSVRAITRLKSP